MDIPPDDAKIILQRIQSEFKAFLMKGQHKPLTFSCGLSYVDQSANQFLEGTELIGHVDGLLYKAKAMGKNRIVTDDEVYHL